MLTIVVILAIWVLLSIPMCVALGVSMRSDDGQEVAGTGVRELLGMDGDSAVYRRADGSLERVSLSARTSA